MIEATPPPESTPRYAGGVTAEVARLALDPSVHDMSVAMAYVVAPEIHRRRQMNPKDPAAFLSLDAIATMVGCSPRNVMKYASATSMVLVEKGTPWWMRDSGHGGFAASWDVAEAPVDIEMDLGLPSSIPVDIAAVGRWLDPRSEIWQAAGMRAWRLALSAFALCGGGTIHLTAALAADLLGCSRSTGHRALRKLVEATPDTATVDEHGVTIRLGLMVAAGASVQPSSVQSCPEGLRRLRRARKRWMTLVANLLIGLTPSNLKAIEAAVRSWESATGRPYETLLDGV